MKTCSHFSFSANSQIKPFRTSMPKNRSACLKFLALSSLVARKRHFSSRKQMLKILQSKIIKRRIAIAILIIWSTALMPHKCSNRCLWLLIRPTRTGLETPSSTHGWPVPPLSPSSRRKIRIRTHLCMRISHRKRRIWLVWQVLHRILTCHQQSKVVSKSTNP